MAQTFFAHIRKAAGSDNVQRQTVEEHSRHTAHYASHCLQAAGLSQCGYVAGLLHDAGKCKEEFQTYLWQPDGKRGSVNHTFSGCRMLLEHFHGESSACMEDVTAELLAYAVGAHHGLFDCVDPNRLSGFQHRVEKEKIHYEESRDHFLLSCASWDEIEARFKKANQEITDVCDQLFVLSDQNGDETRQEFSFYLGLVARLLASAVMEGDRRDTAEFMENITPSSEPDDWPAFWEKRLHRVEEKLKAFPQTSPIQRARTKISEQCRHFAEKPEGVYRLNVPTGGGKTLSSLRYALAHAARWGKKRVIFVTPLLAILEQNAKVIRDFLDEDAIILEHHSNVVQTEEKGDQLDMRELAIESWHAPVILTTMVQVLNTFFLGKTASVRRFQSLCEAVVVIDEVQTIPPHMLSLFNLTVNFLSKICHTTFLLCSATQPCLEQADHPLVERPVDVVPFEKSLWEPFRRTRLTDAGARPLDSLPGLIRQVLQEADSLLVISNKKEEAAFLYRALSDSGAACFHLSASMCAAHRRDTLRALYQALEQNRTKVVCVATQVMEAGVDISFQRVIRLAAGMDNVIQAAGRCNRHGQELSPVPVYVVACQNENLTKLPEMQRAKTVTLELLEAFRQRPQDFGGDLASDRSIQWYYRALYAHMEKGYQDYPLKKERDTLFSLMGSNSRLYTEECPFYGKYSLGQAFRTAGELFQVFEEQTTDVVVPYGEGASLIAELASQAGVSPGWLRAWSQQVKPYTLTLYEYQKQRLSHALYEVNGVWILQPQAYDPKIGLTWEQQNSFLEV